MGANVPLFLDTRVRSIAQVSLGLCLAPDFDIWSIRIHIQSAGRHIRCHLNQPLVCLDGVHCVRGIWSRLEFLGQWGRFVESRVLIDRPGCHILRSFVEIWSLWHYAGIDCNGCLPWHYTLKSLVTSVITDSAEESIVSVVICDTAQESVVICDTAAGIGCHLWHCAVPDRQGCSWRDDLLFERVRFHLWHRAGIGCHLWHRAGIGCHLWHRAGIGCHLWHRARTGCHLQVWHQAVNRLSSVTPRTQSVVICDTTHAIRCHLWHRAGIDCHLWHHTGIRLSSVTQREAICCHLWHCSIK